MTPPPKMTGVSLNHPIETTIGFVIAVRTFLLIPWPTNERKTQHNRKLKKLPEIDE